MDVVNLALELMACGCEITNVSNTGQIIWSGSVDTTLANLVIDAHEKSPGTAEIIALRDYLGVASDEWLSYKAARKEAITIKKKEKYLKECFVAMLELFNGVTATVSGDYLTDLNWPKDKALTLKGLIQDVLDEYPDDWS
ncbi:MAG: hypothetical protein ACFFCZ_20220 [Promethearchaeota archaeon]